MKIHYSYLCIITIFLDLSIASRPSPRTANAPRSLSTTLSIASPTSTISPASSISASPTTLATPTKAGIGNDGSDGEAFLTAAKATVTKAPEVIIDGDGKVVTVLGGDEELELQEKWHLTTFTSCHTFDATFIYCGV